MERTKIFSDMQPHLVRLYHLTAGILVRDKVVVELGTRSGHSTTALLAAVNDSGGHLYCVDMTASCAKLFSGEPNWTFIHGDDRVVVKSWNKTIDHLFIDTTHTFEHTIFELREWGKWLKPHGVISLHDTHDAQERPIRPPMVAIKKYMEENSGKFALMAFPESSGLSVLKRV